MIQTHTHTQWNIRHKKNEILPFAATWMDLEGIMLKWNKLDREWQILNDITYVRNLKIQQPNE